MKSANSMAAAADDDKEEKRKLQGKAGETRRHPLCGCLQYTHQCSSLSSLPYTNFALLVHKYILY